MKATELVFILDKSGSMAGLESDTIPEDQGHAPGASGGHSCGQEKAWEEMMVSVFSQ